MFVVTTAIAAATGFAVAFPTLAIYAVIWIFAGIAYLGFIASYLGILIAGRFLIEKIHKRDGSR